MSKYLRYILLGLLALLIILQFFSIDKTNPPSAPEADFLTVAEAPDDMAGLIKRTCYDCHSNHTRYPWYANVAPVSYWIKGHIDHARSHLNFSTWTSYDSNKAQHKLEECYEEVLEGHMPLPSYTWMHSEARLADAERRSLANWFRGEMSKIKG